MSGTTSQAVASPLTPEMRSMKRSSARMITLPRR
jgi:hypothetical protein